MLFIRKLDWNWNSNARVAWWFLKLSTNFVPRVSRGREKKRDAGNKFDFQHQRSIAHIVSLCWKFSVYDWLLVLDKSKILTMDQQLVFLFSSYFKTKPKHGLPYLFCDKRKSWVHINGMFSMVLLLEFQITREALHATHSCCNRFDCKVTRVFGPETILVRRLTSINLERILYQFTTSTCQPSPILICTH